MQRLVRHVSALLVVAGLATGGLAECIGWAVSAQARMICCAGEECPMHTGTGDDAGLRLARPGTEADDCCALAPPKHSTPPAAAVPLSTTVAVHPPQVELLLPMVPLEVFDGWSPHVPIPSGHVARHVLLSVFLI